MRTRVRTITLDQPWASLIAAGVKRIETRHWPPPKAAVSKPLAIHAGKNRRFVNERTTDDAFNRAVARALGPDWQQTIPLGAVVAVANLTAGVPTGPQSDLPEGDELLFGDYRPNRWMWMLDNIRPLAEPAPARGFQRIWTWEPTTEVAALLPPDADIPEQPPLV